MKNSTWVTYQCMRTTHLVPDLDGVSDRENRIPDRGMGYQIGTPPPSGFCSHLSPPPSSPSGPHCHQASHSVPIWLPLPSGLTPCPTGPYSQMAPAPIWSHPSLPPNLVPCLATLQSAPPHLAGMGVPPMFVSISSHMGSISLYVCPLMRK